MDSKMLETEMKNALSAVNESVATKDYNLALKLCNKATTLIKHIIGLSELNSAAEAKSEEFYKEIF